MSRAAQKETAILALLQQPTIDRAAAQAGISRATLFRWLKDPDFQERLTEARRQATQMALLHLSDLSERATQVLREVMEAPNASPTARVAAARASLELSFKIMPKEQKPPVTGARWVGSNGKELGDKPAEG